MAIGISIGFVVGVGLAFSILVIFRCGRKRIDVEKNGPRRTKSVPVHVKGVDSTAALSDSNAALESPRTSEWSNTPFWLEGLRRKNVASACGIPKYSFKYVNFHCTAVYLFIYFQLPESLSFLNPIINHYDMLKRKVFVRKYIFEYGFFGLWKEK